MQEIGPSYSISEVEAAARARREEDRKHQHIYWHCEKCDKTKTTLVDKQITYNQCKCGCYMVWNYRPFACNAA